MPSLSHTRDFDLWISGLVTLRQLASGPVLDAYVFCKHAWGPVVVELDRRYQFCCKCNCVTIAPSDWPTEDDFVIGEDGPTTTDLVAIRLLYLD